LMLPPFVCGALSNDNIPCPENLVKSLHDNFRSIFDIACHQPQQLF
jgi:hypothetical protein